MTNVVKNSYCEISFVKKKYLVALKMLYMQHNLTSDKSVCILSL